MSQPAAPFHEVPAGFRSVAWLRPEEAESALHAYSGHGDVPIWKNHKVTGWARYHRPDTELARKYRANVLVERLGAAGPRIVCWVREYEAKAVGEAVHLRRDVPFDGAVGCRPGLVQYFPPDSDSASRFRSVTRLLRARAGGWDRLEDGSPGEPDDTARPADSGRASPPLQPGYAISLYTRGELQALIRWVLADGQHRSYEELVATAADVLNSPSRREQVEGSLHSAVRAVDRNHLKPLEEKNDGSPSAAATTSEVRTWARHNGLAVSDRGRLSEHVIAAYNRKHPDRPFAG